MNIRKQGEGLNGVNKVCHPELGSGSQKTAAPSPAFQAPSPVGRGKKVAFTLAEVLITLGIIGVVAAMTMPSLVSDYKVKEIVSKIKKVQSTFSQAVLMSENEYGPMANWEIKQDDKASSELIGTRLKPYLKLIDDCGTATCDGYTGQWNYLNGVSGDVSDFRQEFFYKMRLSDGSEMFIRPGVDAFSVYLDVNGSKAPNVLGRDIFRFLFIKSRISMSGIGVDPGTSGWEHCNTTTGEGWNCTAWILYKENMDYLKCANELEWNGKTKCK